MHSIDSNGMNASSLKRKTSNEAEMVDSHSYSHAGNHIPPNGAGLSYPNRRGSSLAYEKVNLTEQLARRESALNGGSIPNSWEEERRNAQMYNAIPNGVGMDGRAYSGGYGMPGQDYGQARQIPNFPPQHPHPPPQRQHSSDNYDTPRIHEPEYPSRRPHSSNGLPPPPSPMYAPSPSGIYAPVHRPPPLYAIPGPPPPPPDPRRNAPLHANPPPQDSSARYNGNYANLPLASAAWARAGPLPTTAHVQARPVSANLDSLKEPTPYSRSPELRVSHKLAERKRRKEMAQLFDDLRDSLPTDRGSKSSKWEILTKGWSLCYAVDRVD